MSDEVAKTSFEKVYEFGGRKAQLPEWQNSLFVYLTELIIKCLFITIVTPRKKKTKTYISVLILGQNGTKRTKGVDKCNRNSIFTDF